MVGLPRALHGTPSRDHVGRGSIRRSKHTRNLIALIIFLLGTVSLRESHRSAHQYARDRTSPSSQVISAVASTATAAAEMAAAKMAPSKRMTTTAKEAVKEESISPPPAHLTTAAAIPTITAPAPRRGPNSAGADSSRVQRGNIDWRDYRLGDWVLKKGSPQSMVMEPWFTGTLAWEYSLELERRSNGTAVRKKSKLPKWLSIYNSSLSSNSLFETYSTRLKKRPKRYDKGVFCDVVEKRAQEINSTVAAPLLQPGDVVLHLRLGDVVDEEMLLEEVDDAFEHGVSIVPLQIRTMQHCSKKDPVGRAGGSKGWWHYVHGKCYYENVFQKIEQMEEEQAGAASAAVKPLGKRKRLIVVGSAAHQEDPAKNSTSLQYSELVRRFAEERGYEVVIRLDHAAPDDDLVWMSRAPTLVAAGGGFSALVADCVERRGGVVFRSSRRGQQSPLEAPCWAAPRPPGAAGNYSWDAMCWRDKKGLWNGTRNFPPGGTLWQRSQ